MCHKALNNILDELKSNRWFDLPGVKTFHYFYSLILVVISRLRLVCASIEIVLRVGLFM